MTRIDKYEAQLAFFRNAYRRPEKSDRASSVLLFRHYLRDLQEWRGRLGNDSSNVKNAFEHNLFADLKPAWLGELKPLDEFMRDLAARDIPLRASCRAYEALYAYFYIYWEVYSDTPEISRFGLPNPYDAVARIVARRKSITSHHGQFNIGITTIPSSEHTGFRLPSLDESFLDYIDSKYDRFINKIPDQTETDRVWSEFRAKEALIRTRQATEVVTEENERGELLSPEAVQEQESYYKVYRQNERIKKKEQWQPRDNLLKVIYYRDGQETEEEALAEALSGFVPEESVEILEQRAENGCNLLTTRHYLPDGTFQQYSVTELFDGQNRLIYQKTERSTHGPLETQVIKYIYGYGNYTELECHYDGNGELQTVHGAGSPFAIENGYSISREKLHLFFPELIAQNPYYATAGLQLPVPALRQSANDRSYGHEPSTATELHPRPASWFSRLLQKLGLS